MYEDNYIYDLIIMGAEVHKMVGLAKLSDDQIKKVVACEDDVGVVLVAYGKTSLADLKADAVSKVQALEKEIGVTLVAYT